MSLNGNSTTIRFANIENSTMGIMVNTYNVFGSI